MLTSRCHKEKAHPQNFEDNSLADLGASAEGGNETGAVESMSPQTRNIKLMLENSVQRLNALPRRRASAAVLTIVITAIYATLDFTAAGEINVAILYASSVAAAGWTRSGWFLWLTTAISGLLALGGLALGPHPDASVLKDFYVNRSFVVVALIMVATIVHQRMHLMDRIEKSRDAEARQNEALRKTERELRHMTDELEQRVEREISLRLRTEQSLQQAQKMEAIGQLTGGIAHDFNNLLTAVIGNIELIERHLPADDPLRRLTRNARHGADQGAQLVKRLLSFARQQPLEPQVVEIEPVLDGVMALARPVVGESIELSLNIGRDLWRCCVDQAELEAALLNLVINSRDAIAGRGRITLSAQNVSSQTEATDLPGGDYVRFSVQDTGAGMPPEVVARVFEPFFTTKPAGKGSGLGLSMTYGFVKQSGGTVRIDTAPGHGTTVHLYLQRTMFPAFSEPAPSQVVSFSKRVPARDESARLGSAPNSVGAHGLGAANTPNATYPFSS